jgi:hypothetical protein
MKQPIGLVTDMTEVGVAVVRLTVKVISRNVHHQ